MRVIPLDRASVPMPNRVSSQRAIHLMALLQSILRNPTRREFLFGGAEFFELRTSSVQMVSWSEYQISAISKRIKANWSNRQPAFASVELRLPG